MLDLNWWDGDRIDDQDSEGGAKMMIPEDQTTFSRDLEPEYVVLNHDETKAWITLQAPPFFFFFTFVTGLKRSLSHNLSDTRVYEP